MERAMRSEATNPEEYINNLPEDRRAVISKLRNTIKRNIPKGFAEQISYGMIGYVVPLTIYPKGYLGGKNQPLPFMNIASQIHFVAVYHMGLYAYTGLLEWFKKEYEDSFSKKLDIGKSCMRFKDMKDIPYRLIGELSAKISVKEWIELYEKTIQTNSR